MRGQRTWLTLRLYTMLNADNRAKYYKDKKIFHSMGDNCMIMDRKVPLYAKLISIGNNVQIASNVHFNTHDVTHLMLNNMPEVLSMRGADVLRKGRLHRDWGQRVYRSRDKHKLQCSHRLQCDYWCMQPDCKGRAR